MKQIRYLLPVLSFLLWISCVPRESGSGGNYKNVPFDPGRWLVDVEDVFDGGPGKDGIPALLNPPAVPVDSIDFLKNSDMIIGFHTGNEYIAYPQAILDWHEIINDQQGNEAYSVIYCPLTGTTAIWNRVLNGETSTFGVSGLLYQNNIIPYDRASNSNWSQMLTQCINGPLIEYIPENLPFIECSWETWKKMYPDSKVIGKNTGIARPYGTYPYGDYKENDKVYFPLEIENTAYDRKERIHAVLNGRRMMIFDPKVYTDSLRVFVNEYEGKHYLTLIAPHEQIFSSYLLNENQSSLQFEALNDRLPLAYKDNEGNMWNVFGRAVEGPRQGEQLEFANQITGYWFALSAFYLVTKKVR